MKVVTGYSGQNEINIAAERGEVQGNNTGLSNLTVNRADWMRDGKVRILIQYGTERLAGDQGRADRHGARADRRRPRGAALLCREVHHGAPVFAPPEMPAERIAALQAAFDATMKDEQYLADARRSASTPTGSAAAS